MRILLVCKKLLNEEIIISKFKKLQNHFNIGLRFPGYVSQNEGKTPCDYTWLRVIFKEPVTIVPVTGGPEETLPNS